MNNKKIILLASESDSTKIIFNHLDKNFLVHTAILENKESKRKFLKRRIKKLGLFKVLGQIAFQFFIAKWLKITSSKRTRQIIKDYNLNTQQIPSDKIISINSINDNDTINLLRQIKPDIIVVNGTRIISKKILNTIQCPIINIHTGITPLYRGVHGGYWALVNNDKNNCGVTVHLVDAGIDTGSILYQAKITPMNSDNFVTYPFLQTAAALDILSQAINDGLQNNLKTHIGSGNSKLWYHPTIGQYIYNRIFKKVK